MASALEKVRDSEVAVPVSETVALLEVIRRAASDPNVDVEKMERLMAMHERILARQAQADFDTAMSDCQTEMGPIAADASNPQTKSKYATYGALDTALRPIYTKHGFGVSFDTAEGAPADYIRVVCLVNRGGFTRCSHVDMPADGKGAKGGDVMTKTHATGAALTYGRRYALLMAFNLVVGETDNDGNGAGLTSSTLITAEQKNALIDLMKDTATNTEKFLKLLGVPTLDALPARRFKEAKQALDDRKKAAGK